MCSALCYFLKNFNLNLNLNLGFIWRYPMRFKKIFCLMGIWVIFTVLSSLLAGGDAWGQVPLAINYSSLSMSCGATQNLSASGGCPPYTWSLSGGGTLTPRGGDHTSATYVAPDSNPNCANNAMITLNRPL